MRITVDREAQNELEMNRPSERLQKQGPRILAALKKIQTESVRSVEMTHSGKKASCKIGVYVCNCGAHFGPSADVHAIAQYASTLPCVSLVREEKYICAEGGQQRIRQDIPVWGLSRLLIVACSPRIYQAIALDAAARAGLNPFYVSMVNSWGLTTETVISVVRATAARLERMEDLLLRNKPVVPVALVVAGDEEGIESARNIADEGYKVYLVLRQPSLAGLKAGRSDFSFAPFNEDGTECWIGSEDVIDVCRHPNITLLTSNGSGSQVVFIENV